MGTSKDQSQPNGVGTAAGEKSPLLRDGPQESAESSAWDSMLFVAPYLWPKGARLRVCAVVSVLLAVLSKLASFAVPLTLRAAVDALTPVAASSSSAGGAGDAQFGSALRAVSVAVLVYGLLRFASAALTQARQYMWQFVSLGQMREFAVRTFEHVHALSLSYHLTRKTGELLRVMDRGCESVSTLQSLVAFTLGPTVFELLIVCGVLFRLRTPLIAAVTLVSVVLYAVFTVAVTRWRVALRKATNEADNAVTDTATDSLINFETVKFFGSEAFEAARYRDNLLHYQRTSVRSQLSLGVLNAGQSLFVNAGVTVAMLLAARRAAAGAMSAGDFVMINAYILQLYGPLTWLGGAYRQLFKAFTDLEKMVELNRRPPEVRDEPGALPLRVAHGSVRFEHVDFTYRSAGRSGDGTGGRLRDVSFHIAPGRTLAVVGATGSGKSTVVRMLLRLYDADSGEITVDGQNVRRVEQASLRASIGVVAQDTVLFNDTMRFNLSYGKPGASEEEIMRAVDAAQLGDFVRAQRDGLDVRVGERGLRLSGGEKQRVGIARMVLKDPRVIVLDEATSALDTRTERAVQRALRNVSEGRTTLVIAHRLSTVMDAEEIIVLRDGEVAERGSHADLLKREDGEYRRMWQAQLDSHS